MATITDPNKIEDTTLTQTASTPKPIEGVVSAWVPNATNVSNTSSASLTSTETMPIVANPNALQTGPKGTNYDTGKGELLDWTTIKTPADEGGFWSGIDYTGIDKGTSTTTTNKVINPNALQSWVKGTVYDTGNGEMSDWTTKAPIITTTNTWTTWGTTTTSTTGTTTDLTNKTPDQIKQESIDSIIKNLDPNNQLTAEEKQTIKAALSSEDPTTYTAALMWKSNILLDKANAAINAYRLNRDTTLQANRNQQVYDQNVANISAQYNTAIEKAKQNVSDTMNNMSVIAWTSWRIQSKNLTNAVHQALDNSRQTYNDLVSAKDRDLASLASDLKYKTDMLSNEYNDKMTAQMNDILKTIKTLDTAWELDTQQGLTNAKSFLRKSLDATQASTQTYYDSLKYLNDYFTKQKTDLQTANKIDSDVTKTMNDWYLYNATGNKVTNEKWEFLQIQKPTTWTLLSEKPITLSDWSQAMLFQKPDWTIETQVLKWTEPAQMGSDIISHYAQLLASGTLKYSDLKDLPPVTQQAIIWKAAGMPTAWDYQSVVLKDADWNDIPATFNKSTWEYVINGKRFTSSEITSTWLTTPGGGGKVDIPTLLNTISDSEWTHWNYNAMYGKWWQSAIDLTNMTLKQVQDLQKKNIYKDKNWNYVGWAMWKYQIVSWTLNGLIKRMWLTGNEKFSPELQDQMAMSLIWSSWNKFQNWEITPQQFQKKIAWIWAWVPDPTTWQSVYAWDKTNKATSSNAMSQLLSRWASSWTTPVAGNKFDEATSTILGAWDWKDVKKLAKDLWVPSIQAKQMYNDWKTENTLSPEDSSILSNYLKDISWTAVSAAEYERTKQRFIEMRKTKNTQEILNQLSWYVPTKENQKNQSIKNQLSELQTYATSLWSDASKIIAQNINQGNYNKAVQELENATYKQKWVDSEWVRDIWATIKKGNDLKTKIQANEKEFWPVTWWTNEQILKFKDNPEVQGLMADMSNFVAKYRNGIAWSSITSWETWFLEPLVADIKNNPKNAIAKINSIQQSLISELNTTRDNIWLPQIKDWRSAYDINLRSQAYKGKWSSTSSNITTSKGTTYKDYFKKP